MNAINNILQSNLIQNGTIVVAVGAYCLNPAPIVGNLIETVSKNEMLQTVAKVLQSVYMALLGVWATLEIVDRLDLYNPKFINFYMFTLVGVCTFIMSVPIILSMAKYLSTDNKEQIESIQKFYSTTLKVVNIITTGVALGIYVSSALAFWNIGVVIPIALQVISISSSAYTLYNK